MPTDITIHLEFLSSSSGSRSFADSISHDRESSDEGKENLAREMFAELRKAVSFAQHGQGLPDVGDLLQSPTSTNRRSDPMAFIDLFNVPGLWLEISNTFREIRYVLAQAMAYKELEPPNTTPLSDSLCAYLHFEKMFRLNLAVFEVAKIQDLVVRLLHESFSGRLISVDYDDEGWESSLRMEDAKKGLKALAENGELPDSDYRAILDALALRSKSPHRDMVVLYRNRLAHRIRPSVDYPQLYTELQDRAGQVIKDSSGKERGRVYSIGAGRSKPEFLFSDLYIALTGYMGGVAEMLKALRHIPRLS